MTYHQRRARGVCARCPNPSPDMTLCFTCRVKDSARAKRRYYEKKLARVRAKVGRAA